MRRRYITHPSYQYAFTISLTIGALLAMNLPGIIAGSALFIFTKTLPLDAIQQQVLMMGIRHIISVCFFSSLVMAVVFSILGVYFSYKHIGPLTRLEEWLEKYLLGEKPDPLQMRKGDELESIKLSLDKLLAKTNKGRIR